MPSSATSGSKSDAAVSSSMPSSSERQVTFADLFKSAEKASASSALPAGSSAHAGNPKQVESEIAAQTKIMPAVAIPLWFGSKSTKPMRCKQDTCSESARTLVSHGLYKSYLQPQGIQLLPVPADFKATSCTGEPLTPIGICRVDVYASAPKPGDHPIFKMTIAVLPEGVDFEADNVVLFCLLDLVRLGCNIDLQTGIVSFRALKPPRRFKWLRNKLPPSSVTASIVGAEATDAADGETKADDETTTEIATHRPDLDDDAVLAANFHNLRDFLTPLQVGDDGRRVGYVDDLGPWRFNAPLVNPGPWRINAPGPWRINAPLVDPGSWRIDTCSGDHYFDQECVEGYAWRTVRITKGPTETDAASTSTAPLPAIEDDVNSSTGSVPDLEEMFIPPVVDEFIDAEGSDVGSVDDDETIEDNLLNSVRLPQGVHLEHYESNEPDKPWWQRRVSALRSCFPWLSRHQRAGDQDQDLVDLVCGITEPSVAAVRSSESSEFPDVPEDQQVSIDVSGPVEHWDTVHGCFDLHQDKRIRPNQKEPIQVKASVVKMDRPYVFSAGPDSPVRPGVVEAGAQEIHLQVDNPGPSEVRLNRYLDVEISAPQTAKVDESSLTGRRSATVRGPARASRFQLAVVAACICMTGAGPPVACASSVTGTARYFHDPAFADDFPEQEYVSCAAACSAIQTDYYPSIDENVTHIPGSKAAAQLNEFFDVQRQTVTKDIPRYEVPLEPVPVMSPEDHDFYFGSLDDIAICPDLEPAQQDELRDLCSEFSDIFLRPSMKLPQMTGVEHHIDTGNARPIRRPLRKYSKEELQIERQCIRQMLNEGVIEPGHGSWASTPVFVKKPDGSTRFCACYVPLNKVTVRTSHPMPDASEHIRRLRGCQYKFALDG